MWEGLCVVIPGPGWTAVLGWRGLKPRQEGGSSRAMAPVARGTRVFGGGRMVEPQVLWNFYARDAIP